MADRVEDLEIKLSFLENHVHELDKVLRELFDEVRELRNDVAALRETAKGTETPENLEEQRPPHY